MSKYSDLYESVTAERDGFNEYRLGVINTLEWLDSNPGLVPRPVNLSEDDDDRISAWHRICEHPAIKECHQRMREDQTFLDRVLERLTELQGDQVPGRTITESKFQANLGMYSEPWAREFLAGFGITVTPDPEPTNAEKLRDLIDGHIQVGQFKAEHLADYLDLYGVKAPDEDK